jgi:hypothetical protein
VVCALIASQNVQAQQTKPAEYVLKATYLYNFAKFVEWPPKVVAANEDPFAICVLGEDPFGSKLDSTLDGETIDGKAVLARRISKPQEALGCRILFISSSEQTRLRETLAALDKNSILTVSDMPEFSRQGGMIQFVSDGSRVRFEINLTAATGAGLTLSSELLKVATTVRRNIQPGD